MATGSATTGKSKARIRQRRVARDGRAALWEGRFSLIDAAAPAGRRWVSVYGPTRAQAEAKLAEAMVARSRGVAPPRGALTVSRYVGEWLDQTETTLKPSTALRYRELAREHIVPRIGNVRLAALTPGQVNATSAAIVGAGRSARTANHARAVLRAALSDAVRHGLLSRNVAALADARREDRAPVEPMAPVEARAILGAFSEPPMDAIVATALWTGLRMGELLGLTWERVDLDRGQLQATQTLARVAGVHWLSTPKTRGSARTVPIPPPLREVLLAHRERQRELRRRAGAEWDSSWGDLVFCTGYGDPLVGTSVTNVFRKTLLRAGLRHRRFHDLRHGAATLWLAAGVDLKTVSTLLGHSTISTTANIYTGVLDSLKADAAERMTRLLGRSADWGHRDR